MSQPLNQTFNYQQQIFEQFIQQNKAAFDRLARIEVHLKQRFVGMDKAIEALILSVLCGEPLLLVGAPGTAKSQLISVFHQCVDNKQEGEYFRYLLTRFTEPNELFGYFEIEQSGKLRRDPDNIHTIQNARIVFLDEVFNASSAILNSLLTFMNERLFFDRGNVKPVKMQCLFGATNDIPHSNDLRAVFDRFLIRWQVSNIDLQRHEGKENFPKLLEVGWQQTYGRFDERDKRDMNRAVNGQVSKSDLHFPQLLDDIRHTQLSLKEWTARGALSPNRDQVFMNNLIRVIHSCRQYGYSEMSNRRVIKMLHAMFLDSIYQGIKSGVTSRQFTIGAPQLKLLHFAVDRWDDGLHDVITWN